MSDILNTWAWIHTRQNDHYVLNLYSPVIFCTRLWRVASVSRDACDWLSITPDLLIRILIGLAHYLAYFTSTRLVTYLFILVKLNEWERQWYIKRVVFVWTCCSFPWFKRNHEVHPSCWPFVLELFNKFWPEHSNQKLLEFQIHSWKTELWMWVIQSSWWQEWLMRKKLLRNFQCFHFVDA